MHRWRYQRSYAFSLPTPAVSSIESLIKKLVVMSVMAFIVRVPLLTYTTARSERLSLDATNCAHQCYPTKVESQTAPYS